MPLLESFQVPFCKKALKVVQKSMVNIVSYLKMIFTKKFLHSYITPADFDSYQEIITTIHGKIVKIEKTNINISRHFWGIWLVSKIPCFSVTRG